MNTLILDTSRKPAFFALDNEVALIDGKTLSKTFLPALKEKLDTREKPARIAVGIGPGSYVGTRNGVTIGKALSYGWNIPLISFPSPLAFLPDREGCFAYIGDAKMGEFFVITGNSDLTNISAAQLITKDDLPLITTDKDYIISEKPLSLGELSPMLNLPVLEKYLEKNLTSAKSVEICYLR